MEHPDFASVERSGHRSEIAFHSLVRAAQWAISSLGQASNSSSTLRLRSGQALAKENVQHVAPAVKPQRKSLYGGE